MSHLFVSIFDIDDDRSGDVCIMYVFVSCVYRQ